MTQAELAERSGISLRTIQRIEAGATLKGFTLNAIAQSLDTAPENLLLKQEQVIDTERAKLINLSVLTGLIIPFGGIIFPLILTSKTKDTANKKLGNSIVEIQIILTAIFSVVLMMIPFIQKNLTLKFPLFMVAIVAFLLLKLVVVIVNGISLNRNNNLYIRLKTNFL